MTKEINFPALNVRLVPTEKIVANDYNPNHMASPEMRLLKISIEEDGYTQPIVTYYNADKDIYEVVDGFHRYLCNELYFHLPQLPVVVIDKPIDQRIASTIRTIARAVRIRSWICRTSCAGCWRAAGMTRRYASTWAWNWMRSYGSSR